MKKIVSQSNRNFLLLFSECDFNTKQFYLNLKNEKKISTQKTPTHCRIEISYIHIIFRDDRVVTAATAAVDRAKYIYKVSQEKKEIDVCNSV
mgnify:CR=1 FL=1